MKKKILSLALVLVLLVAAIPLSSVIVFAESVDITAKFTDLNFRAAIYKIIGKTTSEPIYNNDVNVIKELIISDKNIESLDGIEYFSALTYLNCEGNQLKELNVSNNTELTWLNCGWNQIVELDLSKNIALIDLECYVNKLTNLDLSKNMKLGTLSCWANKLTKLDISNNTALTYLDCAGTQLIELDVSKNSALTYLDCHGNQLINLDVSNNTKLWRLDCTYNYINNKSHLIGCNENFTNLSFEPQNEGEPPTQSITNPTIEITTTTPTTTTKPIETTIIEIELIYGDTNSDGQINIKDVTVILSYIVKTVQLIDDKLLSADVNDDKKVNISDVTEILKYLVKLPTDSKVGQNLN